MLAAVPQLLLPPLVCSCVASLSREASSCLRLMFQYNLSSWQTEVQLEEPAQPRAGNPIWPPYTISTLNESCSLHRFLLTLSRFCVIKKFYCHFCKTSAITSNYRCYQLPNNADVNNRRIRLAFPT